MAHTVNSPHSRYRHAFAIVRVDGSDLCTLDERISVVKVVLTEERAKSEVDRLNTINQGKDCQYFWVLTRLEQPSPAKVREGSET